MESLNYNLKATFQKSYYGKAIVKDALYPKCARVYTLQSYETDVCQIIGSHGPTQFKRLWDGYSRTTMIHVNEFRWAHGMPALSKKQWEALPVEEDIYNR